MKHFFTLFICFTILSSGYSQQKAHKITYRYMFDISKAEPFLAFFGNAFKDKYQYKTYLCYKNQSISYNDDSEGEKNIKSIEELEQFSYHKNGTYLSYELTDNNIYKVTKAEDVGATSIAIKKQFLKYGKYNCSKISFGSDTSRTALSTNLYPPEWGCIMLPNYKNCILQSQTSSSLVELVEDVEIDSMQVIKFLQQINKAKTKVIINENNIVKADKGNVAEGNIFPAYILKDVDGNRIDSKQPFLGFKVLFFWSDMMKNMELNIAPNSITYNKLLKEFNELATKDIKVVSCFWGNKADMADYTPDYTKHTNLTYITSTQNWSSNYLNIKNFITVVITNSNNKVLYKGHLNCIKGEVDALKIKIQSFK